MTHQISDEMLSNALYSVNKRAKNYRDMKRRGDGAQEAEQKEREMYDRKEILLSLLDPVYIHSEPEYETEQVVDDDPEFYDKLLRSILDDEIIWWSSFYRNQKKHYFFLKKKELLGYQYYLFYPFKDYSYHLPISEEELDDYPDLPVREILNLATNGEKEELLMPLEKVDEIIGWIQAGDYEFFGGITEEDIDKHWDSNELSFETERRIDEAYEALRRYVENGILESHEDVELSEDDEDALTNMVYQRLYGRLLKCNSLADMRRRVRRVHFPFQPLPIQTELIYACPPSYTKDVKRLIQYWDKKGCFKREQEYYKKIRKARTYCREEVRRLSEMVIKNLCEQKEIPYQKPVKRRRRS